MVHNRLIESSTGHILLEDLIIADTFSQRLVGLMGKNLNDSQGLLIKPCNSIHCFFMKMPIDVIFLNQEGKVIHRIDAMRPWSISPIIKHANSVIEASAGAFKDIQIGSKLTWRKP